MIGFIVVLLILGTFTIGFVALYNGRVQLCLRCDAAWSDIDVQLKSRYDLIPNLVDTVKHCAAHEKGTVEEIAKLRSVAALATPPADKATAEGQLTESLKTLFGVAGNYPLLKASEEFTNFQGSLSQTENAIQSSRSSYNSAVRHLNPNIQSVPANAVARSFDLSICQFFEQSVADRELVALKF